MDSNFNKSENILTPSVVGHRSAFENAQARESINNPKILITIPDNSPNTGETHTSASALKKNGLKVDIDSLEEEGDINIKLENVFKNNNSAPLNQNLSYFQSVNADNNSTEKHINEIVIKLRHRVIIYEYMCYKSYNYYSILSKIFTIPCILISSIMTIINSNLFYNTTDDSMLTLVKVLNIVAGALLTFLMTLQNFLKFVEKADYFFNTRKKFSKLHNTLNNEIVHQITNMKFSPDSIQNFLREYDYLDDSLTYEFPRHIINDVKSKFSSYSLPTICNGIEVSEYDVQPREHKTRKRVRRFSGMFTPKTFKKYTIN
jgi:hypothetical protein